MSFCFSFMADLLYGTLTPCSKPSAILSLRPTLGTFKVSRSILLQIKKLLSFFYNGKFFRFLQYHSLGPIRPPNHTPKFSSTSTVSTCPVFIVSQRIVTLIEILPAEWGGDTYGLSLLLPFLV